MNIEKIHRGNYEEFFLLYVDNELSAAEKNMVDAFVEIHPDLKIELNMLMDTKLQTESISFGQKELLLKNDETLEEWQLLSIDNELSEKQQIELERSLASDANASVQFEWLKKTKLPQEEIIYPYKEKLYKRSESVVMMRWLIPAAAAVLIGVFLFNPLAETENSTAPVITIAENKNTTVTKEEPVRITETSITQESKTVQSGIEKSSPITEVTKPKDEISIADVPDEKPIAILPKPSETLSDPIVATTVAEKTTIAAIPVQTDYASDALMQNIIEEEQEQPKKGLRGIIRKASRIYNKITQPDEDKPLIHFARLK